MPPVIKELVKHFSSSAAGGAQSNERDDGEGTDMSMLFFLTHL